MKKDTNKNSQFYGRIILESLDKRFKVVDFNEETNIVQAISYVDNIKLPVPVKKSFIKEFTGEEESKTPEEEAAAIQYKLELQEQE